MSADPQSSPGPFTSLRAGLNAGALVGALAGLFDGLVRALGIDASVFLHQVAKLGPFEALGEGLPGPGDLLGLTGCIAATVCVYGLGGMALGALVGLALHPLSRAKTLTGRYERVLGLLVGLWLFVELFWWTKTLVYPGVPIRDPRRIVAALVLLVVALALGRQAPRLRRRAPRGLRLASPFLVVGGVLAGGFYLGARPTSADRGRVNARTRDLPNVVVFVVDALRQDVLGAYGNTRVETPVIDRLAREGVVFEEAFAQAPFTWTSFGSFLTGKYPRRHGLLKMAAGVGMGPNVTLPFYMQGARRRADGVQLEEGDYVCAAFMTGTLSHGSGLLRGFDVYCEALVGHDLVDVHDRWSAFRSGLLPWMVTNKVKQLLDNQLVASTAVAWLEENARKRFVSLVHYYSTHAPYDPPDEFKDRYVDPAYDGPVSAFYSTSRVAIEMGAYEPTEADVQQIRALYYGGVTMADHMIGLVIDELEARGVLDDTIVVVTSDHGESLGEHGLWEHNWMFEDNLRIPLIVRFPDRPGRPGLPAGARVTAPVSSIDLVPTLLDLMQLAPLPDERSLAEGLDPRDPAHLHEVREVIDGRSLLPLVRGEVASVRSHTLAENGRYHSVSDGSWKLIVSTDLLEPGAFEALLAAAPEDRPPRAARLFELERDPGELDDRFAGEPERAAALFAVLRAYDQRMPIRTDMLQRSARDDEAAQMAAMGYGTGVNAGDDDEVED
jgi:arylsulfatase A-like enzyme